LITAFWSIQELNLDITFDDDGVISTDVYTTSEAETILQDLKVHEYYAQARKRVFDILEHLDAARPLKLEKFWKQIEARSGSLPKGQRWFLMSKVFMLTPTQIAEIEGLKNADSVSALIIRVSDQSRGN